jgi:hypothetical protein
MSVVATMHKVKPIAFGDAWVPCFSMVSAWTVHWGGAATRKGDLMLLTKHENEAFLNQTVYISGQAFIKCTFTACTLVLRETLYHLDQCTFERCNWHVDWVLMWGSPESIREIKALVAMIEQAQQQALAAGNLPGGSRATSQAPVQ